MNNTTQSAITALSHTNIEFHNQFLAKARQGEVSPAEILEHLNAIASHRSEVEAAFMKLKNKAAVMAFINPQLHSRVSGEKKATLCRRAFSGLTESFSLGRTFTIDGMDFLQGKRSEAAIEAIRAMLAKDALTLTQAA